MGTRALALLALALALAAGDAAAQSISGSVLDADRGFPLPLATLLLVDSAGTVVDSTRADADAAYSLRATGPGRYFVHVRLDGWAAVPSDGFDVEPGRDRTFDVRIPLIGPAALRQMSSILEDEAMQRPMEEICGEPLRPWEAGVLLGVIREGRARTPVAGARVVARGPDGEPLRSTVSNARGAYVLCNLPAGLALRVTAESADGAVGETDPEIRPGVVSWYDIPVRPARRRPEA